MNKEVLQNIQKQNVFAPKDGYNLIASCFDTWKWTKFWEVVEAPFVKRFLSNFYFKKALDAGSGTGPYIKTILANNNTCYAYDISENMLLINKLKNKNKKWSNYYVGDILHLTFEDAFFDFTICTRVFSNIRAVKKAVSELSRTLKNGGGLLITDIHPKHPYEKMGVCTPYGKKFIETYRHNVTFIQSCMNEHNLIIKEYSEFNLADFEGLENFPEITNYFKKEDKFLYLLKAIKVS